MATTNDTKKEHLLDNEDSSEQQQQHQKFTSSTDEDDTQGNGTMQSIAGVMGNVLEWYDFALFGFFSDIIATNFFAPSDDNANGDDDDDGNGGVDMGGEIDTSNLVRSFAVYGGAFLMRPVGGLVIGYSKCV